MSRGCVPLIVLILFIVPVGILGCSRGIDTSQFEDVYKAARNVEAATLKGVSKDEFGGIVKTLAIELARLEKKPLSAEDKKLYDLYVEALLVYDESYGFWDTGYREFDPDGNEGLALVAKKFGVPTEPVNENKVVSHYENGLKWMKFDMMDAKGAMDHEASLGAGADKRILEEHRRIYEQKLREYEEHKNRREQYIEARKKYVRMDGDKVRDRMWLFGADLLKKAYRVQENGKFEQ